MQANSGEQVTELRQQVEQLEGEIKGKGKQLEASEAQLSALKADHEASKSFQVGAGWCGRLRPTVYSYGEKPPRR